MSLTSFKNFKKECITFGEPVEDKHGGIRIRLSYNDDSFYLETPILFSFGVQESVFNNKKFGYQIPLCLHSKEGVTADEEIFIKCLQDIQTECHEYLKKNFSPDASEDLSKIIYTKPSSQAATAAPLLYLKLDWDAREDSILTLLTTKEERSVSSLLSWMEGYCKVVAAIHFKSIYIGQKSVSIQLKAEEIYFYSPRKHKVPKKPMLEIVEEDESDEE